MKRLLLYVLFLPVLAFGQANTYDGFYLENGELIWEGIYKSDLPADAVRDALLEKLGTADGFQLSNYQPKDKVIGKAEVRGTTTTKNMMMGVGSFTYAFGFVAAPAPGGYLVKVTNYTRSGAGSKFALAQLFPNEKWLDRGVKNGKILEYTDRLWSTFQIDGAESNRSEVRQ